MTELRKDGKLVPFELVLDEASGPVSPKFQYTLKIRIHADGDVIRVTRSERAGVPKTTTETEGVLSDAQAAELFRVLDAHGGLAKDRDLVGDKRGNVGVSFNELALTRDGTTARLSYTLAALKDAAHTAEAAIVQAIKDAASRAAPASPGAG